MYVKTQWVDNTTPIDKNNLNKIEQGIYDNSLVVDAVTNTLNPTDTETYKTAELTEGQITDVIGVNDIIIKGQTSQDGTPTPSAPVDVNVVSGSNVVNTSNKNLWNFKNDTYIVAGITAVVKNGTITLNGTATDTSFIEIFLNNIVYWEEGEDYTISAFNLVSNNNLKIRTNANGVDDVALTAINKSSTIQYNLTTSRFNNKISIRIQNGTTLNNFILKPMLEQSSTATTYEPHQGKELPLDLPVENLFDGIFESGDINSSNGADESNNNRIRTKNYIKVPKNSSIIMSILNQTAYSRLVFYDENKNFISTTFGNNVPYTFTTGEASYIRFSVNTTNIDIKAQVEQGSKSNAYTPYGIDPIELCKIGNYQDYFYKSGSKWYLHKEIGKVILDGSESWSVANTGTSNFYYQVAGLTTPKSQDIMPISDYFIGVAITNSNTDVGAWIISSGTIRLRTITEDTLANFKTWLSTNTPLLYYVLATSTDTEITDTTLISQLEAIYNAPLYEETNITQTNNDLPMILDITACKDNINGIKAWIRR